MTDDPWADYEHTELIDRFGLTQVVCVHKPSGKYCVVRDRDPIVALNDARRILRESVGDGCQQPRAPQPQQPTCASCRFFYKPPENTLPGNIERGECRRHAPTLDSREDASAYGWPRVKEDQWCGEWQMNDADRKKEIRMALQAIDERVHRANRSAATIQDYLDEKGRG